MNKINKGQQLVLKTAVEFSNSIRIYNEELERMGKRQITNRLLKKATVTSEGLIQSPNIESLAEFIRESRMFSEGKETPLGILLCIYSGIDEDVHQLLDDLESLNKMIGK